MKNLYALLFTLLFFPIFVFGQKYSFGMTGSFGASWMSGRGEKVKWSESKMPSYNIGIFVERNFDEGWALCGGVSYVGMKHAGKISGVFREPLDESFEFYDEIAQENQFQYIAIPLYLKYRRSKVACSIGLQSMFLNFAFVNKYGVIKYPYGVRLFDLGAMYEVEFFLIKQASISIDLYQGLSRVSNDFFFNHRRNRQLTLGLNYYLTKQN